MKYKKYIFSITMSLLLFVGLFTGLHSETSCADLNLGSIHKNQTQKKLCVQQQGSSVFLELEEGFNYSDLGIDNYFLSLNEVEKQFEFRRNNIYSDSKILYTTCTRLFTVAKYILFHSLKIFSTF